MTRFDEKEMAMRQLPTLFKDGLMGGGITLLVVMAFPMAFLLAITLRFAVIAACAMALLGATGVAIGGGLAYAIDPGVRDWVKARTE
jgi:hypothetical protein